VLVLVLVLVLVPDRAADPYGAGEGTRDAGEVLQEDGGGGGDVPGERQGLLQPVQGDARAEVLDLPQELLLPEVQLGNVACPHPSPLLGTPFR
jgi:hypothetical protein